MSKFIDLIGKRFGRLVIIQRVDNNKWKNVRWLCLCDCEKKKIISSSSLMSGDTKSCGCLRKEVTRNTNFKNTKHGHLRGGKPSLTYASWKNMKERCINLNHKSYKHYGGRGITVCKRWGKFENFLEDMGEVPEEYQIDRIDNDGNYCKSNCRWATRKEQNRNTRRNHFITHNGKTQCLSAWAEEFNIRPYILRDRIKSGWSMIDALTTPVKKKVRRE